VDYGNVFVIDAGARNRHRVIERGANFIEAVISRDNFSTVLGRYLSVGDVLVNLASGIGARDVIRFCQSKGILYVDSCTDVWDGEGVYPSGTHAQRKRILDECSRGAGFPTALICHGANPGLITHFAKAALRYAAASSDYGVAQSASQSSFATLARAMDVSFVQLTDRDSQECGHRRCRCPCNTWSLSALFEEMFENASLTCGTHETIAGATFAASRPMDDARQAVELGRPARQVMSRSWSPERGPFVGYVVGHEEVFALGELLSLCDSGEPRRYAPSVSFVYSPCPRARSAVTGAMRAGTSRHGDVLAETVERGGEEIGALILRQGTSQVHWYGCSLDIATARASVPFGNATTVQAAAGVLAGLCWVLRHPSCGIVEPEQLDHDEILRDAGPYLGRVFGETSHWHPHPSRHVPSWRLDDLIL
jgi:homospermidine synthase